MIIKTQADLKNYSNFKTGGIAELLVEPKTEGELIDFLNNRDKRKTITIIGGGFNTLIRDGELKGYLISTRKLNYLSFENNQIIVQAGVYNSKIFNLAKKNLIAGYEFLATIPGTIGGACIMNAGCHSKETKDLVKNIKIIDFDGNIKILNNDECGFFYRNSKIPKNSIILEVVLNTEEKNSLENIEVTFKGMMDKRLQAQPYNEKTCGCCFKNPENTPAWKLIQEVGFQNKNYNGALFSEKHANFLINKDNTTAKDLENLIEDVKQAVKKNSNIELELEIKIIGDEK